MKTRTKKKTHIDVCSIIWDMAFPLKHLGLFSCGLGITAERQFIYRSARNSFIQNDNLVTSLHQFYPPELDTGTLVCFFFSFSHYEGRKLW